jgi:hypothetical protein
MPAYGSEGGGGRETAGPAGRTGAVKGPKGERRVTRGRKKVLRKAQNGMSQGVVFSGTAGDSTSPGLRGSDWRASRGYTRIPHYTRKASSRSRRVLANAVRENSPAAAWQGKERKLLLPHLGSNERQHRPSCIGRTQMTGSGRPSSYLIWLCPGDHADICEYDRSPTRLCPNNPLGRPHKIA